MDLLAKSSVIINIKASLNNYKKRAKRNQDQNKDRSDIFEADSSNVNIKKNDCVPLDSDYNNNSI